MTGADITELDTVKVKQLFVFQQLGSLRHKIFILLCHSLFGCQNRKSQRTFKTSECSCSTSSARVPKGPKLIWSADGAMACVLLPTVLKSMSMKQSSYTTRQSQFSPISPDNCCKTHVKFTIYISWVSRKEWIHCMIGVVIMLTYRTGPE